MTPIHAPLAPLPFALTDPLHDQKHLRGTRDIAAMNSQLERFMERIRQAPIRVSLLEGLGASEAVSAASCSRKSVETIAVSNVSKKPTR